MSGHKDSKRGKHLFEVQVEVTTTVLHLLPVNAENFEHAGSRGVAIVKAGNTKAVGGAHGLELHGTKATKVRRVG